MMKRGFYSMKKSLLFSLLIIALICTSESTLADGTGILLISRPEEEIDTINMDDMKIGNTAHIPGYGNITLLSSDFMDFIPTEPTSHGFYNDGRGYENLESGSQAEYLSLRLNILNTQKKPYNFAEDFCDVLCVFGDDYQFGGWSRQERKVDDKYWTMYPDSDQSDVIDPLYEGIYDIVITLPNYVVESKEPLSVTFSIGKNEFTCNIRES